MNKKLFVFGLVLLSSTLHIDASAPAAAKTCSSLVRKVTKLGIIGTAGIYTGWHIDRATTETGFNPQLIASNFEQDTNNFVAGLGCVQESIKNSCKNLQEKFNKKD